MEDYGGKVRKELGGGRGEVVVQKRHFTIRSHVPRDRSLELYILVLDAPSRSLILLESTTQQKNLLTATTHSPSLAAKHPLFLVSTF